MNMELGDVLLIISTTAMFVHGYSCRKRYRAGVILSTVVAQIPVLTNISSSGITGYGKNIVGASSQDWIIGIICVMIVWGIGYMLGGVNLKKRGNSDNIENLQGKDVNYKGFKFD
jgi:hypothetical protein